MNNNVNRPQPVSGQAVYEAASAAAPSSHHGNWDWIREDVQAQWNAAAARLAAPQGVGVVTPDQMREAYGGKYDAPLAQDAMAAGYINDILWRGAAPAAEPKALPVTWLDMEEMCIAIPAHGSPTDYWQKRAEWLNKKTLRARAGTAGTQWVKRPEAQVGTLVVPEDGWYFTRNALGWSTNSLQYSKGEPFSEAVTAIRAWDTTHGMIGPTIERAATAGGWTARDVEACAGKRVALIYDDGDEIIRNYVSADADWIADAFNKVGIVAYYVFPPVEAQP